MTRVSLTTCGRVRSEDSSPTDPTPSRQAISACDDDEELTLEDLKARAWEAQHALHAISHELEARLRVVRGFVSALLDGVAGEVSDDQREYLVAAKLSCDRMNAHMSDILDLTRLETGLLELEPRACPVDPIIRHVVAASKQRAVSRGIHLSTCLEPGLPAIWGDECRVIQILNILVDNALRFTEPRGEVELGARGPEREPGHVEIWVRDTGRGMNPSELERVFERPRRVSEVHCTPQGRLGLGLNICRRLVRLHGGSLQVGSKPGQGSTFAFTLPATAFATR